MHVFQMYVQKLLEKSTSSLVILVSVYLSAIYQEKNTIELPYYQHPVSNNV